MIFNDVYDVAIVGAGQSGMAAAYELHKLGVGNFIVIEARDRVGGRTVTQDLGDGAWADGGGQWIGPMQTAVHALADELGAEKFPFFNRGKVWYDFNGTRFTEEATAVMTGGAPRAEELTMMASTVPLDTPWLASNAQKWDAMSVADWEDQIGLTPDEHARLALGAAISNGGETKDLSLLYYLHYARSSGSIEALESAEGGAQETRITGGTQTLPLKIADIIGHEKIQLHNPVRAISGWDGEGPVTLETENGPIRAREVVMALGPPLAARIDFQPGLPEKRVHLQQEWPTYAKGIKIHLKYPTPFWRADGWCGRTATDYPPALLTVDNSPADASCGIILIFWTGELAPTEPEQMQEAAVIIAERLGPNALQPTGYAIKDWNADQWSEGCVSPLPPGLLTKYGDSLREPIGNLFWAGTEVAAMNTGYIDGAVRAGQAAATRAAASLAVSR
jgi:monoamine oxidase